MNLNCKLVFFYVITGFLSLGWGLTKPSVDLGPLESDYITLGELRDGDSVNSYLDCAFDLDDGEEVASVTWHHGNVGNVVFVWKPNKDPLVYDFLVDRVNMTREDGNIEFLERHREYEGVYFCEVATNAGSAVSDPYQILTVDLGSRTYTSSRDISEKECVEVHSESTPAIYPAPEVNYGVWFEEQWILNVSLTPIKYSNGSWQYTLKDREIETDKFPDGSVFRLTVGVRRGEEYVPIWTATSSIRPCTKTATDDGNDGGGEGEDGEGSDVVGGDGGTGGGGGQDGGGNVAPPSHRVSLVAVGAVALCVLFVR